MSNEKQIIAKLIKIASNQQKIINKLAQVTAPAHLEPNKPVLDMVPPVLKALEGSQLKRSVLSVSKDPQDFSTVVISVAPGVNLDTFNGLLKSLFQSKKLEVKYNLSQ